MSVVRFGDLVPVPWKNGLGVTREIAVSPVGASMEDFVWRVSIADVDSASPFSRFPGVDRTIVLLDGDGFTMALGDGHVHALTTPWQPFAFAGEATVTVTLAGGATRDFNLMARRDRTRAQVGVIHLDRHTPAVDLPADCVLAYLAQGSACVSGTALRAGDAWLGSGGVQTVGDAVLLVVTARSR